MPGTAVCLRHTHYTRRKAAPIMNPMPRPQRPRRRRARLGVLTLCLDALRLLVQNALPITFLTLAIVGLWSASAGPVSRIAFTGISAQNWDMVLRLASLTALQCMVVAALTTHSRRRGALRITVNGFVGLKAFGSVLLVNTLILAASRVYLLLGVLLYSLAFIVVPVAVFEGKRVIGSIKRSLLLTQRHQLHIVALLLLAGGVWLTLEHVVGPWLAAYLASEGVNVALLANSGAYTGYAYGVVMLSALSVAGYRRLADLNELEYLSRLGAIFD